MEFTKKTIVVRAEFYERLQRDAFFQHSEIKVLLDAILRQWIADNPERPHKPVAKLKASRAALEVEQIKDAMAAAGNRRADAAAILGISRMMLNKKCRLYGLTFPHSIRAK